MILLLEQNWVYFPAGRGEEDLVAHASGHLGWVVSVSTPPENPPPWPTMDLPMGRGGVLLATVPKHTQKNMKQKSTNIGSILMR